MAEQQVMEAPAPAAPALPAATRRSRLPGGRKAAILLVSLGPERAAEVFGCLRDEEIEGLSLEMAKAREVSPTESEEVMAEASETLMAYDYMAEGGVDFAREVLERSLGSARASEIMDRLSAVIERRPSEFLQRTPPEQIYAFVRDESPQTIALILASLQQSTAAQVLALMPAEEQADAARRIATMRKTSPEVVDTVYAVIREKLANLGSQEYSATGGVDALAAILGTADRTTERNVLDMLAETDAPLADEVRAMLFTFEDIVKLEDRAIQQVLREVDTGDLALALRGVPAEVQEKVFTNMSARGAEMLSEEMEYQPPQRRSAVEEAQGKIVATIRRLEDSGAIVVNRGGGDDDAVI